MSSTQIKLKSTFDNKKNSHAIEQSQPLASMAAKQAYGYPNKNDAEQNRAGNYSSISAAGDRDAVNTTQSQTINMMHSLTELNPNQSLFLVDESKIDKESIELQNSADVDNANQNMSPSELQHIQKQEKQKNYLLELDHLTSDNCPKRHPFDFRPSDLGIIKKIFPEFKNQKQAINTRQMGSNKQIGASIKLLKKHFLEVMELDPNKNEKDNILINNLMEKLDHRNSDKITWAEFLKFLDHEGMKREMVNDAQLYGIGVKRMKEKQRINLKETPNQIEHYIDCCTYINFNNSFKFLLAIFENNQAKIFDANTFKVVQELNFPSNYGQPKVKQANVFSNQTKKKVPFAKGRTEASIKESITIGGQKSFTLKRDAHSSLGFNSTKSKKIAGASILQESSNKTLDQVGGLKQERGRSTSKGFEKEKNDSSLTRKPYSSQSHIQQRVRSLKPTDGKRNANLDIMGDQSKSAYGFQSFTKKKSSPQPRAQTADERRQSLIAKKSMINQKYGRKFASKPKNQAYGILGLDSLVDQEGSTAFFAGKDLEITSDGYGIREILPDLYSEFGRSKEAFEKLMNEKKKVISQNDKHIKEMQPYWDQMNLRRSEQLDRKASATNVETTSLESFKPYSNVQRFGSKQKLSRFNKGPDQKQMQEQISTFLMQKQVVRQKIEGTEKKMEHGKEWLKSLRETNKYFYRLTSPSPYMVAQQQYIKKLLEKRGVDTTNQNEVVKQLNQMKINYDANMIRNITGNLGSATLNSGPQDSTRGTSATQNYCTPEMISGFVQKLRHENKNAEKFMGSKSKSFNEANQRKQMKQMQTKAVYAMCCAFSEELGLLALSLIDKEIKIYRIKQNGAKISFIEHMSFHAKYIITCICISRCASNSRPILCMGSKSGDIQIYYIDESSLNKNKDGTSRENQHECSPFNFFRRVIGQETHIQPNIEYLKEAGSAHEEMIIEEDCSGSESAQGTKSANKIEANKQRDPTQKSQLKDAMNWPFDNEYKKKPTIDGQAEQKEIRQKGYKYKVTEKTENEITCIRYIRDIGLICSTFNGTIKFFDAFNFNELWCTTNKQRKEQQHTNITVFDISTKLGLMATGGAEGRLILVDPYAFGIINGVEAHQSEILQLYIFDEQQQIITVAEDRSIGLWDASRLEKIEVIKDVGDQIHTPKFSSSSFDYKRGQLFIGCQQISVWEARTDQKVEINALQIQTLSKDVLRERKMLDSQDPSYQVQEQDAHAKKNKDADAKTGKVLVTSASTLVEIILNQADMSHFLITIDSENLLRCWNIEQSLTTLTYRLPVHSRVTAAAVDDSNKFLAVGTSSGESKVINLKSGGVLYNLAHCNSEVTYLKFIDGQTEYWLFGACWGGKLMMWTQPTEDNNFTISARCRVGHKSDVLSLDCSQNFIVSGGVDGIVSVWNVFSGQLKYAINMPNPNSNSKKAAAIREDSESLKQSSLESDTDSSVDDGNTRNGRDKKVFNLQRSVVGICFHPFYQNHVCILQEGGDIHMIDATNGVISHKNLAKAKMNSCWACDPAEMKMFVVGDVGRARLYDISMEADQQEHNSKSQNMASGLAKKKKQLARYNSPPKWGRNQNQSEHKHHSGLLPMRWPILMDWFIAHKIHKMEPSYVVSCKFVDQAKIFVSGTTSGEVKLWDNKECTCLGVLNSPDWDPADVLRHMSGKTGKNGTNGNSDRAKATKMSKMLNPTDDLSKIRLRKC